MARPVFLSYAREDEDLADRLDAQLRLRGVPVWRDRRAMLWGAYNEDTVLDAIEQRCSGFVLLLTDAVMTSDFILNIELPAMARRRNTEADFFAGAVFARDAGVTESARQLYEACGVELSSPLGTRLSQEDLDADLRNAARGVLLSYLRAAMTSSDKATARIETRGPIPESDLAVLHLAWSPPLTADLREVSVDVWDDELLPALADVRAALEEIGAASTLDLCGRPHLSAALAVGHEFRAPTGWTLSLHQDSLDVQTARVQPAAGTWKLTRQPSSSDGDHRLVLCLHATKDVSRAMREHCRSLPPARVELHVRPPSPPGHLAVQADGLNALCATIDTQIADARERYGVAETHLYLACPWVMAATLGWHLSSVGRLVSHEADVERSSYRAACQLA
jgi:hypothetical protein